MSPTNIAANIAEDLAQCDEALRAARLLRDVGLLKDAASRLYYAVFHCATALLLTEGLEPSSHRAILSMLGLHFIRPGKLPASLSPAYRRLQAYREAADYTRGFVTTPEELDADIVLAETFIDQVRAYLKTAGY